jgi:hypothetical protein
MISLAVIATANHLQNRLDLCQGRATARVLDLDDVLAVIAGALKSGYATTGVEGVATSYGYTARSTACDAVVDSDGARISVAIDRVKSKSSSPLRLSMIQDRFHPVTKKRYLSKSLAQAANADWVPLANAIAIVGALRLAAALRHPCTECGDELTNVDGSASCRSCGVMFSADMAVSS